MSTDAVKGNPHDAPSQLLHVCMSEVKSLRPLYGLKMARSPAYSCRYAQLAEAPFAFHGYARCSAHCRLLKRAHTHVKL